MFASLCDEERKQTFEIKLVFTCFTPRRKKRLRKHDDQTKKTKKKYIMVKSKKLRKKKRFLILIDIKKYKKIISFNRFELLTIHLSNVYSTPELKA